MFKESYKWHFDYVNLAIETGFEFEKHKIFDSKSTQIYAIDVDRLIKTRDITTLEKLIPHVIEFGLDEEQARILDNTFVKTFRIGQLLVEYLLFCKQYLDNAIILLREEKSKVEEENTELQLFVDELKEHIAVLMQDLKDRKLQTFKCDECTKVFSTDEFLKSHKQRRHSINLESEVLHMEIKELKGRLNSAEKLIQKDQSSLRGPNLDHDNKVFDQLQVKFESLRLHVESELKSLQTQKNFEEKYEKWVEKLASHYKTKEDHLMERGLKKDECTQTDLKSGQSNESKSVQVGIGPENESSEMSKAIEVKVSTSLQKIENQMEQVWQKINTIEEGKKEEGLKPPPVKPRSKFTPKEIVESSVDESSEKASETYIKIMKDLDKISIKKNEAPDNLVDKLSDSTDVLTATSESNSLPPNKITNLRETSDSGSSESDARLKAAQIEKIKTKIQSPTKAKLQQKTSEDFLRNAIEKLIKKRLQDLGISPDWKGLPSDSYQRVLQIVNHQRSLLKKTYPNVDKFIGSVEKEIVKNTFLTGNQVKRKKVGSVEKSSPQIEINRKMYESDSSDAQVKPKVAVRKQLPSYSAVVAELKSVTTKVTDSESSTSLRERKVDENAQKSALKNYPSMTSLTTRKRVNFYLNSEKENRPQQGKYESTTSITSSVFDPAKPSTSRGIELLSDYDSSD